MSTPPSSDFPFQVIYSEALRNQIQDLAKKAAQQGSGEEFLHALEEIDQQLHSDPLVFGEPLYSLPAAHLKVRHAVMAPLSAIWAVHSEQFVVFMKNLILLDPP